MPAMQDFMKAPAAPFAEFLGDMAALGVRPVTTGGIAYGMMQARSNARWWLLPIGKGGTSSASIAMYQPGSAAARIVRTGIRIALRIGVTSGWATGRMHFDRLPKLPGAVIPGMAACAYFTGTDGPHRKTAIQIMDRNGGILGYAKLSRRASVRPYLSHEAAMLTRMARLALETASVPTLLAFEDDGRDRPAILVTDSRKTTGIASPLDPGRKHLAFLQEMAHRTGAAGASSAYLELVDVAVDRRLPAEWSKRFGESLQHLAPFAGCLPVALAHGDFTPWNSFVQKDRLYVFDWEYAARDWPVGYDLAHYILSARGAADPGPAAERLVAQVATVFAMRGSLAKASVLMSLLLHARFYLRRAHDYSGNAADWTDGHARGRVIDALLDSFAVGRGARGC